MATRGTINELYDLKSLEGQQQAVIAFIKQYVDSVKTANGVQIQLGSAKGAKEITNAIKQLNAEQQKLADLQLKIAKAETEYAKARLNSNKADTESVKTKKEQVALEQKLAKEKERLITGAEKEAKAIEKANNEYIKLNEQYKIASAASLKRGAELLKEAAGNELLFKSLLKTDKEYIATTKSANDYQRQLLLLEQNVGRSQRNVGNYASAFNGLNNSFGQIARELPSLAINFQTFALAISNNLPIAIDEIQRAQQEIARLRAEGIKAPSLFKQITGAIFSFQVGISVAIAAFTLLAPKIAGFFEELFKGKKIIDELTEEQKKFTDILAEEKTQLDVLFKTATDANVPLKARKEAIKELRDNYGAYLKNFSDEEILAGKAASAYESLSVAIVKSARARAAQDILVTNQKKLLDLEIQLQGVREKTIKQSQQVQRERKIVGAAAIEVEVGASEDELRAIIQKRGRAAAEEIGKQRTTIQQQNDLLLKTILGNQVDPFTEETNKDAENAAKKLADLRKQLREDELAAQRDLILLRLELEADAQQRIFESEKFTLDERLNAIEKFERIRETIISQQLSNEIATIKERATEAGLGEEAVQNQIRLVREKFSAESLELVRTTNEKRFDIIKADLDKEEKLQLEAFQKRIKAIETAGSIEIAQLQKQRDEELLALSERANATGLSFEEQQKERLNILRKYAKLELEAQLSKAEELAKLETDPLKRAQLEAQIAALRLKIDDELTDEKIKNLEKIKEEERRLAELQIQLQQEVFNLVKSFTLGRFDVAKNQIQDQIDKTEEQKRVEIDAINATTLSAQEKAARITNAEKKAQSERERLELRQRQLDRQRAQFEKAFSLAQIAINTIREVGKIKLAVAGHIATLNPVAAALATSQIPFAIAIGAIQAAAVLSTPIPRFKTGKGAYDQYEGPAWVGDGGKSEMIFREDGSVERTPSTPVMTWVGKNDIIHPDANALMNHTLKKQGDVFSYTAPVNYQFDQINATLKSGFGSLEKTVQNKREYILNMNNGQPSIKTRDGNRLKTYLNNNLQFGGND